MGKSAPEVKKALVSGDGMSHVAVLDCKSYKKGMPSNSSQLNPFKP